ncbi:MAG: hypothetical protein ACP5LA_06515, partial [Thermoplasmata archaeon]
MSKILTIVLVIILILGGGIVVSENSRGAGSGGLNLKVWPSDASLYLNNVSYQATNGSIILTLAEGKYQGILYRYGFTPLNITFNITANQTTNIYYSLKLLSQINLNMNFLENEYPYYWGFTNGSQGIWKKGTGYQLLNVTTSSGYSESGLVFLGPVYGNINGSFTFQVTGGSDYEIGVQLYGVFPSDVKDFFNFNNPWGLAQNGMVFGIQFNPSPVYSYSGPYGTFSIQGNSSSNGIYVLNITSVKSGNYLNTTYYINGKRLWNFQYGTSQFPYLSIFSNYYGSSSSFSVFLKSANIYLSNPPLYYTQGFVKPSNGVVVQYLTNGGWGGTYYKFGNFTIAKNGYYVTVYPNYLNMTYYIDNNYLTYSKNQPGNNWFNVSLSPVNIANQNYQISGEFDSFPFLSNIQSMPQNYNLCWISTIVGNSSNILAVGCYPYIINASTMKISNFPQNSMCCVRSALIYNGYYIIGGNSQYPIVQFYKNGVTYTVTISNISGGGIFGLVPYNNTIYAIEGNPLCWGQGGPIEFYSIPLPTSTTPSYYYVNSPIKSYYIPVGNPFFYYEYNNALYVVVSNSNWQIFVYRVYLNNWTWQNITGILENAMGLTSIYGFNGLWGFNGIEFYEINGNLYVLNGTKLITTISNSEIYSMNINEMANYGGYYFASGIINSIPTILMISISNINHTVKILQNFMNDTLYRYNNMTGTPLGISPYITSYNKGLFLISTRYGPYDINLFPLMDSISFNYSRAIININPLNNSSVYIDGQLIPHNNTGSIIKLINVGKHNILVTNPNYYTYNGTFTLLPLENKTIYINLTKATSFLKGYINPPGSTMLVGNLIINTTSGEIYTPIPLGSYLYSVKHKYYNPASGTVVISNGINWLNVTLVHANGYLNISANVNGYTVLINGTNYYIPGKYGNISLYPSVYNIIISHKYYNNVTIKNVIITSNNTTFIQVSLVKANGTLIINSPINESVYLNSKLITNTRGEYILSLNPGYYWVNATATGYKSYSIKILITSSNVTYVNLSLEKYYYIKGSANVQGYGINVNGMNYEVAGNSYNITVTNGTYNLTFTKNYYHPIFYTLNI